MVLVKQQGTQSEAGYIWQSCFCSYVFTLPRDYSHVSFQRPLMTNESHLAKRVPITMRLNPSFVQQSSHHFVKLQKQYKTYFPLTMTSAEKVLPSSLFSHLFLRNIFIFQTSINITLAPAPHLNVGRELVWNKGEWSKILLNCVWYQVSWEFATSKHYRLRTYPHEESHKHR